MTKTPETSSSMSPGFGATQVGSELTSIWIKMLGQRQLDRIKALSLYFGKVEIIPRVKPEKKLKEQF